MSITKTILWATWGIVAASAAMFGAFVSLILNILTHKSLYALVNVSTIVLDILIIVGMVFIRRSVLRPQTEIFRPHGVCLRCLGERVVVAITPEDSNGPTRSHDAVIEAAFLAKCGCRP